MSTIELDVQGMSCGGCAKHVTQSLRALPGAGSVDVDVDLAGGRVRLSVELGHGSEADLCARVPAVIRGYVTFDRPSGINGTEPGL
jgi:copper chaperone CopZ